MRWLVFPYFNEAEVVEIKLAEMESWFDAVVIVEGNRTYAGAERELDFQKHDWSRWEGKIRYKAIDLPLFPGFEGLQPSQDFTAVANGAWLREEYLRNSPLSLMPDLEDDDVVLLTDADEIVKPDVLRRLESYSVRFHLPQYVMHLNWRWVWEPQAVARITTGGQIMQKSIQGVVRGMEGEMRPVMGDMGWHFSYMGGRERARYKIMQAAHIELAKHAGNVERSFETGEDLFSRGASYQLYEAPLDELPEYVQQNYERFEWMFGDKLDPVGGRA